ncbi:MAG: hypothetical protein RL094_138 [Candidatus Parcubacteria bacterium]|jgi:metal-responsive CopG/Arc/MetJ family transcriptional regulator
MNKNHRKVVSISLSENLFKIVTKEYRAKNFDSLSEFFRFLIRNWIKQKEKHKIEARKYLGDLVQKLEKELE